MSISHRRLWWLTSFLLSTALTGPPVRGQEGSFAAKLPEFSLKDPKDEVYGRQELLARGAVLVVTVPNIKHAAFQAQWKKRLLKTPWPAEGPRLVFVEDLSQSAMQVLVSQFMKEKYERGPTLLLVDVTGHFRRALRIQQDETVILIYDRNGGLVHSVSGLESADEIYEGAKKVRAVMDRLRYETDARKPSAAAAETSPNGEKAATDSRPPMLLAEK